MLGTTSELQESRPVVLKARNYNPGFSSEAGVVTQSNQLKIGSVAIAMGTDKAARTRNEDAYLLDFYFQTGYLKDRANSAITASVIDAMGGYEGGLTAVRLIRDRLSYYASANNLDHQSEKGLEYANASILAFCDILRSAAYQGLNRSATAYPKTENAKSEYLVLGLNEEDLGRISGYAHQLIEYAPNFDLKRSKKGLETLAVHLKDKFSEPYLNPIQAEVYKNRTLGEVYYDLIVNKAAPEISLQTYVSLSGILDSFDKFKWLDAGQREIVLKSLYAFIKGKEAVDTGRSYYELKNRAAQEFTSDGMLIDPISELMFTISQDGSKDGMTLLSMGAAAITSIVANDIVHLAWIGDCSALRYSNSKNRTEWITHDQTLEQDMTDNPEEYFDKFIDAAEELSPEQKRERILSMAPSYSNILLSSLGRKELKINKVATKLRPGEVIIMMSDGLKNKVPLQIFNEIILKIRQGLLSVEAARDLLLQYGETATNDDNKTVIILQNNRTE